MTQGRTPPILEVVGLRKILGGRTILEDVTFDVPEGTVTGIIGASGSGKSTMLRCLNLLIQPDGGDIRWSGASAIWAGEGPVRVRRTEKELLRYRTRIGMVFQSYNLFPHMTAIENIIEAPMIVLGQSRDEAMAQAEHLLDKVRLGHRRDAYPGQMSGGEQQRVAIARALAMKPKALLFDEVTSALDPELKGEVLAVMRGLAAEGMTMISVSHEMNFIRGVADRVIYMADGRIVESGPPEEVLGNPQTPGLQAFLSRVD